MDSKTASKLESLRKVEDEIIAKHRPKVRAENANASSSERFRAIGRRIMAGAESRSTEGLRKYQRTMPFTPTIEAHLTATTSQSEHHDFPRREMPATLSSVEVALRRVDEPAGSDPLFEEKAGRNDLDSVLRDPDELAMTLSSIEETLDVAEAYELSARRYVEAPASSAH
jgi:hypothetical protein